ncbi:hypothetical protein [Mycobacterium sp.]|uniref:hypothetical protein n=1 Tax=Mycobacterium sp. TaxID=1785 RepID=UPI0025D9C671|nr:hypothetical protein [Mycobacterium sp.]MBW0015012.1 hypothetical protein [Mycobacterium sp.]
MSETSDAPTPTTSAVATPPPTPAYERAKPPRLYVVAAWVVIVAGVVFIVATIFFAGAAIAGFGGHCYQRYHHGMMYKPWGPGGGQWQYGGPYGPGMVPPFPPPPGFGPPPPGGPAGPAGPGGPSQSPTTSAPAPPRP